MDYDQDQTGSTDGTPMRTAGEIMKEKARKLERLQKQAAEDAQVAQKERDPSRGVCAHLRISYQTMPVESPGFRVMRSWWACDDCGVHFAPATIVPFRPATDPTATDPTATKPFVRPSVQMFANIMEDRLRRNDHKGGWRLSKQGWLLMRLKQEVLELEDELQKLRCSTSDRKVIPEAADVANFAMMIADIEREKLNGALEPPS